MDKATSRADTHDHVKQACDDKLGEHLMQETRTRFHWICTQITGHTVLDVGCSQGIIPVLLAREGREVTGVDNNPGTIEEAAHALEAEPAHVQQNIRYVNADFLSLDALGVEPDSIVISKVLEHLIQPNPFVEKAVSMLKPGGQLVITVSFGADDFIDHQHLVYLQEPFRLLSNRLDVTQINVMSKWLGMVAIKKPSHRQTLSLDLDKPSAALFVHPNTEPDTLLERAITQQKTIEALHDRLRRAEARRHLAEQRLIKTRASVSYQLGYQLKTGTRTLGGLIRLPVNLFNLYCQTNTRRKNAKPKNRDVEAAAKSLPPPMPTIDVTPPTPVSNAEHVRNHLLKQPQPPALALKVACVMDELTYSAYQHECDLLALTPHGWRAELQQFQPQLLFIESAWRGKDDLWGSKVGHNSQELQGILAWCKQHQVPSVFWNKEDPVHFETFLTTAKQFDVVFTTDIDCIHRYKASLGHDRIYLLPFACQPAMHNPVELYERKDAFCFAGAYYARYPERSRDLANLVSALPHLRPLNIFDRNFGKGDTHYQFPAQYQPYIAGTLCFDEIDRAYKGYRYGMNLNSVKQSQSMFARRVFELLGSNTLTLSNFSRGLRLLFGDLVISTDSNREVLRRLEKLARNEQDCDKVRLAALRKVMMEHTYAHRLRYVLSKVTGKQHADNFPRICVIAEATNSTQLAMLNSHIQRQHYSNIVMYVVTRNDLFDADYDCDPRLHRIDRTYLNRRTLASLPGDSEWLATMLAEDYYGPNYVLDLALATRYSRARVVGKTSYYRKGEQEVSLVNPGQAYRCPSNLPARAALIHFTLVADEAIQDWLKKAPTLDYAHKQCLAIDAFNYCRNAGEAELHGLATVVNDLVLDTGISIDELQAHAQTIPAPEARRPHPQIRGSQLAALFDPLRSNHLRASVEGGDWHIASTLEDGKHEYHYAKRELAVDVLGDRERATVFLDATPGLNIQWVLLFLDAQKQRISHLMQHANRNQTFDIPPEAAFVRLGIRLYANGSARIRALVLGHREQPPCDTLAKSDYLLVTNHYPAYDDLYRNGFVHTRVCAYKEQGLNVDVFRLRPHEAVSYHEFENIDVVTGSPATLAKMLDTGAYKSVLVHFLDSAMWEVLSKYAGRLRIIVWVHGAEIQPWWRREYNFSTDDQRTLGKLDSEKRMTFWRELLQTMPTNLKMVFVSRHFAEDVMADLGVRLPENQYAIIHNPINTELFSYVAKPVEQRKKILSIRPYTSRTYANDLSVKAIQLLAKEPWFHELTFQLMGDGPLFEETVAPLRGYSNVRIDRGFLQREEIARIQKEYGIFLCPSRMDTQGVSRDEAMAAGLVPITNRVAAIPEFVDETCARVVEPEDPRAIADAIEELFFKDELFTSLSENASRNISANRSSGKVCAQELLLIKGL